MIKHSKNLLRTFLLLCTLTFFCYQTVSAAYHPLLMPMYDPLTEDVCSSGGGAGGVYSGPWDPLTLVYPAIPNEAQVIENTKQYILEHHKKSPFASNLQYVSQIFTLSKQHNVNPFLVLAIARQENGFGKAESSATRGNNYFGITDGPNSYLTFSSVEAGIDYFVEKVGKHVKEPSGAYTGLTNFYEYLSIHQAGLIAYPNEYPDNARGKNAVPPYLSYDPRMNVYTSWDPARNNHIPGSPMYNPGIYYKNSIAMINEITNLNLPDTPSRGAAGTGAGCSTLQNGLVSLNGYSFPLEPQTQVAYSTLPCAKEDTCHHDGTPAYDLSYEGVAGKKVYAITSGKIHKISTQDPGWCQSIQLHADDGYYYWYGHIINLTVSEGDRVAAGQQIAQVAEWTSEHTCKNTSSGAHLHIDRGCLIDGVPQTGGRDECRDPSFVPFLKELYNSLPKS